MAKTQARSEISREARKRLALQGIALLLALGAVLFCAGFLIRLRLRETGVKKELLAAWERGAWSEVYEKSSAALAERPLDAYLLTLNGFSAYQMALAQVSHAQVFDYLDESIRSLRRVLLGKNTDRDGRVRYVLGKAYYARGPVYADLAIKYLEAARGRSFGAGDLDEYLGLSYAAVRDYRKSVEAFTASLRPEDEASDMLLLYIARSYMELEEWDNARAYLVRCAGVSRDTATALRAELLLGQVLRRSGDEDGAAEVFEAVLEKAGENAEASYELGEIYAERGETTRARAAWRRANRADPGFVPARNRLNAM